MISSLFSNIYLTEVDRMLEKAKTVTRNGPYTYIEYARWADDLVILVDDVQSTGPVQSVSGPATENTNESRPRLIRLITPGAKRTGKPSAANPHAGFDVAGAGNGAVISLPRQPSTLESLVLNPSGPVPPRTGSRVHAFGSAQKGDPEDGLVVQKAPQTRGATDYFLRY